MQWSFKTRNKINSFGKWLLRNPATYIIASFFYLSYTFLYFTWNILSSIFLILVKIIVQVVFRSICQVPTSIEHERKSTINISMDLWHLRETIHMLTVVVDDAIKLLINHLFVTVIRYLRWARMERWLGIFFFFLIWEVSICSLLLHCFDSCDNAVEGQRQATLLTSRWTGAERKAFHRPGLFLWGSLHTAGNSSVS